MGNSTTFTGGDRYGRLLAWTVRWRELWPGRRRGPRPRWRIAAEIVVAMIAAALAVATQEFALGLAVSLLFIPLMAAAMVFGVLAMASIANNIHAGQAERGDQLRLPLWTQRIGSFHNLLSVVGAALATCAAVALSVGAVAQADWRGEVSTYLLANAALFVLFGAAFRAFGMLSDHPARMLVSTPWWEQVWLLRQVVKVGLVVPAGGVAAGVVFDDGRAIGIALLSVAVVMVGWARSEHADIDAALRRLVEAADVVALNSEGVDASSGRLLRSALASLELACYRDVSASWMRLGDRFLIDADVIEVIRGCRAALGDVDGALSPLAQEIRDRVTDGDEIAYQDVAALGYDIRRLVLGRTPRSAARQG